MRYSLKTAFLLVYYEYLNFRTFLWIECQEEKEERTKSIFAAPVPANLPPTLESVSVNAASATPDSTVRPFMIPAVTLTRPPPPIESADPVD